jgi:hypothetical protein
MHPEALFFVRSCRRIVNPRRVLEFGSLDINGSARTVFPEVRDDDWHGIDLQHGPRVDEIADAADFRVIVPADLVICCEVLEHSQRVEEIVESAHENLKLAGYFLVTCAAPPRAAHSAVDGGELREGEHYRNITKTRLASAFRAAGFRPVRSEYDRQRGDLYALAQRIRSRSIDP